jgi:hypothetical protein
MNGAAIGHASPATFLTQCGVTDSTEHAELIAREYSAAAIVEKYHRCMLSRAGIVVSRPKADTRTDDDDLLASLARKVRAATKAGADNKFLREQRARLNERKVKYKVTADRGLPPINRPEKDLYETAIEEAGHAIYYELQGYSCSYATIVPEDMNNGHVQWGDEIPSNKGILCRIFMAGPLAKAEWTGTPWNWQFEAKWAKLNDIHCDAAAIDSLGMLGTAEFFAAEKEIRAALKKHWHVVAGLADLLIQNRTVSGADIRTFVQSKLGATVKVA